MIIRGIYRSPKWRLAYVGPITFGDRVVGLSFGVGRKRVYLGAVRVTVTYG